MGENGFALCANAHISKSRYGAPGAYSIWLDTNVAWLWLNVGGN